MGNSHAKKAFEKLDRDKNGWISLGELLSAHEAGFGSLMCLFYFDNYKEGVLSYKQFVELDNYVQSVHKKVMKERRKKKHSAERAAAAVAAAGGSSGAGNLQRTPSKDDIARMRRSSSQQDPGSVPALVGGGNGSEPGIPIFSRAHSHSSLGGDDDRSQSGSVSSASESEGEDEAIQEEVRHQISIELLPSLNKDTHDKAGRHKFLEWLFRVADTEQKNMIGAKDLRLLLSAVSEDGIDITQLTYDQGEPSTLVNRIMSEYDSDHPGYLTKSDFLELGDLILRAYEQSQQRDQKHMRVGKWELTHNLGSGSYGVVMCAVHHDTGQRRAIKIIRRGNVSDMSRLDVEIQAMMMLRHPNVVRLEDVIEMDEEVYLVMEICGGGSLYEHLNSKPFDEDLARYYFLQLLDGLEYCHANGVCHRDLRLENLLLDNEGNLKITDFGQAGIFKKGWDLFATQLVGTMYHLSPEQIQGRCYSGEKIDIWNAGVVLYCLLTAQLPFSSVDAYQLLEDIKAARYTVPPHVSMEAKDLISKMLQVDPEQRWSPTEIRGHPWCTGCQRHPCLVQYTIDMDSVPGQQPVDECWQVLLDCLADCDVAFRPAKHSENLVRHCKCLLPEHNTKFSVSLMAPEGGSSSKLVVQLTLREGESKVLKKTWEKIQTKLPAAYYGIMKKCGSPPTTSPTSTAPNLGGGSSKSKPSH